MFDSQKAKIEFLLKMIDNIEKIVIRHKGIVNALNDQVEGQPALMMCLMQIGETLKKIDKEIAQQYNMTEDIKGAYDVRNFIAHDYDRVDLGVAEDIIRIKVPKLKKILETIFDDHIRE